MNPAPSAMKYRNDRCAHLFDVTMTPPRTFANAAARAKNSDCDKAFIRWKFCHLCFQLAADDRLLCVRTKRPVRVGMSQSIELIFTNVLDVDHRLFGKECETLDEFSLIIADFHFTQRFLGFEPRLCPLQ